MMRQALERYLNRKGTHFLDVTLFDPEVLEEVSVEDYLKSNTGKVLVIFDGDSRIKIDSVSNQMLPRDDPNNTYYKCGNKLNVFGPDNVDFTMPLSQIKTNSGHTYYVEQGNYIFMLNSNYNVFYISPTGRTFERTVNGQVLVDGNRISTSYCQGGTDVKISQLDECIDECPLVRQAKRRRQDNPYDALQYYLDGSYELMLDIMNNNEEFKRLPKQKKRALKDFFSHTGEFKEFIKEF